MKSTRFEAVIADTRMDRGDGDVLEVQVVGAHEDADLHEVERIKVVVIAPLEAAEVDVAQVPRKRQDLCSSVSVRQTFAQPE